MNDSTFPHSCLFILGKIPFSIRILFAEKVAYG